MKTAAKTTDQILTRAFRSLMALAAAVLIMGYFSVEAQAATGTVKVGSAVIRSEASTRGTQIGGATSGTTLTINGKVQAADGYVWYQVTFDGENGVKQTGYVRSDLMNVTGDVPSLDEAGAGGNEETGSSTPTAQVTPIQPVGAKVNNDQVRVRADASTSSDIVTTLTTSVQLTIVGQAADSEGKTWYQVTFDAGSGTQSGFVRYDYISLEGEVLPAQPETPDTPDQQVPEEQPDQQAPSAQLKDYDTTLEDEWYLVDNVKGEKWSITEIFEGLDQYKAAYEQQQKTVKSQKTGIIILVVLVILFAIAATLLFFKVKDLMDDAYFSQVEKETVRGRQGASRNTKGAVHTGGRPAGQTRPAGAGQSAGSQARPAGSGVRPAGSQGRPVTGNPQTRPAGSSQGRPVTGNPQTRPAGSSQGRPVTGNPQARPAGSSQGRPVAGNPQARPAGAGQGAGVQGRPAAPSGQRPAGQPRPAGQGVRPVSSGQSTAAKPRSASSWEDDFDLEDYEFLKGDDNN